jgi:transposase/DNA-directed RNA polymerase subunit K/omega
MLTVETIGRIRREFARTGSIRGVARRLKVSRDTVRAIVRSGATERTYTRRVQPRPKLGAFEETLVGLLAANAALPKRNRRSWMRLYEDLAAAGYTGGYDTVRRFARQWQEREAVRQAKAFVPLEFPPGDAYQFDWSQESVHVGGNPVWLRVAHVRLCHSRLFYVRAYPRETQEMVFDAHDRAFRFFGGTCRRGIYDNMTTAVEAVFAGKDRRFNRRFEQMCSHYLIEPVACSPAAGWEKGQVESQVGWVRDLMFAGGRRWASLEELNGYLEERCRVLARETRHPELKERTVWAVYEAEHPALVPVTAPFDGFQVSTVRVSSTCLVGFDRNRYSVDAGVAGRTVQLRAYADRLVVLSEGKPVATHARQFGRDKTVFDAWHYLPVLARKPGALRNGKPFKDWPLPPGLAQMRRRVCGSDAGDRQFVRILACVPEETLDAVEAACAEALTLGTASADVVLNLLARRRTPPPTVTLATPARLRLTHEPVADLARYDALCGRG